MRSRPSASTSPAARAARIGENHAIRFCRSVRHAVAVGYPDERVGERVCVFVVADRPFDLADCRAWFEARGVAVFKTPERVVQVDDLPTLGPGKPDRATLRDRAARLSDDRM